MGKVAKLRRRLDRPDFELTKNLVFCASRFAEKHFLFVLPSTNESDEDDIDYGALLDRVHQVHPIVMKPINTMDVPRTEYGTTASSATHVWPWRPNQINHVGGSLTKLVDSKTPLEFVVVCVRGSISSSHLR